MPAAMSHEATAAAARTQEHALGVVRSWVDAFNRRDVEALVCFAHPSVVVYPSLFRHQDRYGGHDGLRRWIAGIVVDDTPEFVWVTDIWQHRYGEFLVTGEIVLRGRPVGPVAGLVVVRDGLVMSARSYPSDEQTMRDVGHVDR
jgi:ketosteroid isomerase-like protein